MILLVINMACTKDTIENLRKMANEMELENKKVVTKKLEDDFESLLDSTEVRVFTTTFMDIPSVFRIGFIIPENSELYRRFAEVYGRYGYPGLEVKYKGHDVWVHEMDSNLVLRCGPFPEIDKNDFEFLKILPKKNMASIIQGIQSAENCIKEYQARIKKMKTVLSENT